MEARSQLRHRPTGKLSQMLPRSRAAGQSPQARKTLAVTFGSHRRNKSASRAGKIQDRLGVNQGTTGRTVTCRGRPREQPVLRAQPGLPNRAGLLLVPHTGTANRALDRSGTFSDERFRRKRGVWSTRNSPPPAHHDIGVRASPSGPVIAFEQPDRPAGCPRVSS